MLSQISHNHPQFSSCFLSIHCLSSNKLHHPQPSTLFPTLTSSSVLSVYSLIPPHTIILLLTFTHKSSFIHHPSNTHSSPTSQSHPPSQYLPFIHSLITPIRSSATQHHVSHLTSLFHNLSTSHLSHHIPKPNHTSFQLPTSPPSIMASILWTQTPSHLIHNQSTPTLVEHNPHFSHKPHNE